WPASSSPSAGSTVPPGKTQTPGMNPASSLRFSSRTSRARSACSAPRRISTTEAAGRGVDGAPKFGCSAGPGTRPPRSPIHPPYGVELKGAFWRALAEGAAAVAADPGPLGEPGQQRDQGDRAEHREGNEDDAGTDREDVPGVVQGVAEAPAAGAR